MKLVWIGVIIALIAGIAIFIGQASSVPGTESDWALIKAARGNDLNGIRKALKDGANPNFQVQSSAMDRWSNVQNYEAGNTALLKACQWGNLDAIKTLIDAGAKVDLANELGATPLMAAASHLQLEAVELLLARGANVTLKSNFGATARDLAKKRNVTPESRAVEIVLAKALVKAGVDEEIPPPL